MGQDKKQVYNIVKSKMTEIIDTLKAENINIWVRPELTGKEPSGETWTNLFRFPMKLKCYSHV